MNTPVLLLFYRTEKPYKSDILSSSTLHNQPQNSDGAHIFVGVQPYVFLEDSVIITAHIGDTVTLSSAASLNTGIVEAYQIPKPDNPYATDYPMHRTYATQGLSVQVADVTGVSEENPIIGRAEKTVIFPALPIEIGGPGINAPVWFRTPDGATLEIQIEGPCLLPAFEMSGELSSGGPSLGPPLPVEGSVRSGMTTAVPRWNKNGHRCLPEVRLIPPGVTRIQLRGID